MARFFHGGAATGTRNAVVAPANVVLFGVGALIKFFNETRFEQALDGAVERARAELHFPGGAVGDFLHDAIAVALAISESDEDVEAVGRQRGARHWSTLPGFAIAKCGIVGIVELDATE